MTSVRSDRHPPPGPAVEVELARSLGAVEAFGEAHRAAIERELAGLAAALGIPARPTVTITTTAGNRHPLELSVDGRHCPYPPSLLGRVASFLAGRHPQGDERADLAGLVEPAAAQPDPDTPVGEHMTEFLARVCTEIVASQPSVLLGLPQAAAYAAMAGQPGNGTPPMTRPPDPSWLQSMLATVLDLRISIADRPAVAATLAAAAGRSNADAIEDLIDALRPTTVDVLVHPGYLRELTEADPDNEADLFTFLREGLYLELGVDYPPFRFMPTERLPPRSFAFVINHLPTLGTLGLEPGGYLVDTAPDPLDWLDPGATATATVNPATGRPNVLVGGMDPEAVTRAGPTTWDQREHFILVFAAALRANGHCLVSRASVEKQIDQLGLAFPALVRTARALLPVEHITRILRALVAEQVSVRDLRLILERMLDWEDLRGGYADAARERDLVPLQFVRAGLATLLADKHAAGTNTIVAYLMDDWIERMLTGGEPSAQERERILAAISREIAQLAPDVPLPVMLTTAEARARLRAVVATEWPRLAVTAFEELPPQINVEPIARVTVSS
jgi:type III secretion protein V